MTDIRSRNNNVFRYCAYWGKTSRVLFHDAGGPAMDKMRRLYDIPEHIKSIEVDLTAISPHYAGCWRDHVQHGNIRCHCTTYENRDMISGTLPDHVDTWMKHWLHPRTINLLLHADYLPFIDFDKFAANTNGGAKIKDCFKTATTQKQFVSMQRQAGAGPGLLLHDVESAYLLYREAYAIKLEMLTPSEGLMTTEYVS